MRHLIRATLLSFWIAIVGTPNAGNAAERCQAFKTKLSQELQRLTDTLPERPTKTNWRHLFFLALRSPSRAFSQHQKDRQDSIDYETRLAVLTDARRSALADFKERGSPLPGVRKFAEKSEQAVRESLSPTKIQDIRERYHAELPSVIAQEERREKGYVEFKRVFNAMVENLRETIRRMQMRASHRARLLDLIAESERSIERRRDAESARQELLILVTRIRAEISIQSQINLIRRQGDFRTNHYDSDSASTIFQAFQTIVSRAELDTRLHSPRAEVIELLNLDSEVRFFVYGEVQTLRRYLTGARDHLEMEGVRERLRLDLEALDQAVRDRSPRAIHALRSFRSAVRILSQPKLYQNIFDLDRFPMRKPTQVAREKLVLDALRHPIFEAVVMGASQSIEIPQVPQPPSGAKPIAPEIPTPPIAPERGIDEWDRYNRLYSIYETRFAAYVEAVATYNDKIAQNFELEKTYVSRVKEYEAKRPRVEAALTRRQIARQVVLLYWMIHSSKSFSVHRSGLAQIVQNETDKARSNLNAIQRASLNLIRAVEESDPTRRGQEFSALAYAYASHPHWLEDGDAGLRDYLAQQKEFGGPGTENLWPVEDLGPNGEAASIPWKTNEDLNENVELASLASWLPALPIPKDPEPPKFQSRVARTIRVQPPPHIESMLNILSGKTVPKETRPQTGSIRDE